MTDWQRYRVIADPVTAIRLSFAADGFAFRFTRWGGTQAANAGDWLVEASDGSVYTVAADVFAATYRAEGSPGRYRKYGEVDAMRATSDGSLTTLEGSTAYVAGDMIVRGQNGDMWAMSLEKFDRRYAIIPPPAC